MHEAATAGPSRSALALLRVDHAQLEALLKDYALLCAPAESSPADREGLVARVGATLSALIALKEELLYPLLDGRVDDAEMQAARSDHRQIEAQLQLVSGNATDSVAMDRDMTHLAELVRSHITLEEQRLLPAAEDIDSEQLCERMAARRAQLRGEQGPD